MPMSRSSSSPSDLGYASVPAFSHAFRQVTGKTPTEFAEKSEPDRTSDALPRVVVLSHGMTYRFRNDALDCDPLDLKSRVRFRHH